MSAMEFDGRTGVIYSLLHQSHNESINALYECRNKEELIKYLHASLCSPPKTTLIAAAKAGYLHGFPGLTAEAIARYIRVEENTETGHMRAKARGSGSTTTKSARGRPKLNRNEEEEERFQAMRDATMVPQQEPENTATKKYL